MSAISEFVNDVCSVLFANNGSIEAMDGSENLWNTSTLNIGNAWLHGDGSSEEQQLIAAINAIDSDNNSGDPNSLQNFMNSFATKWSVSDWCLDFITALQGKIATYWDSNMGGVWNGMASQESSLIQATSGQDTSTGDAESKASQSALQNATSAGQPVSNAGDSIVGILSNGSSVQAQISG